eukprot:221670-Prymnesium_polylepis.1
MPSSSARSAATAALWLAAAAWPFPEFPGTDLNFYRKTFRVTNKGQAAAASRPDAASAIARFFVGPIEIDTTGHAGRH